MMSIGSRIKQRRTELNMSQEVLAEKIGVSRSAISNWEIERNYPDLQVIVSLSDILEIPLDTLLKGDAAVVEKISTDTVQRKSLSKKLKFAYIFIAILIVLMGFALHKTKWIDISSAEQIKTFQYDGENFIIATDLPFYRSMGGCAIDYSNNGEIINLTFMSYRDLSMTNEEVFITNAYLYPNTTKVAVVYNNEPLVMYNIEDIDLRLK